MHRTIEGLSSKRSLLSSGLEFLSSATVFVSSFFRFAAELSPWQVEVSSAKRFPFCIECECTAAPAPPSPSSRAKRASSLCSVLIAALHRAESFACGVIGRSFPRTLCCRAFYDLSGLPCSLSGSVLRILFAIFRVDLPLTQHLIDFVHQFSKCCEAANNLGNSLTKHRCERSHGVVTPTNNMLT